MQAARSWDGFIIFGLVLLVFWLPVPFGSNRDWAIAFNSLFVSALLLLWGGLFLIGKAHFDNKQSKITVPVFIWLLWLMWILTQILPLDIKTVGLLSPESATIQSDITQILGETSNYSISVSSSSTMQHLIESLTYFGLYLLVVFAVNTRFRMWVVLTAIAVSVTLQASYGFLMVITGTEWGFLSLKEHYLGYATGTFVNRNHLAGYIELGGAVVVGMILVGRNNYNIRGWRQYLKNFIGLYLGNGIVFRMLLALMIGGLIVTRSRMGIVAFFTALLVAGVVYLLLTRKNMLRGVILLGSIFIIDLVLIGQWFGVDKVLTRLEETEPKAEERAIIFKQYPEIIEKYWVTGSGLGSFEDVFEKYRSPELDRRYKHAHNDYAQFLIEVGIPGTILLFFLGFVHVIKAIKTLRKRKEPVVVAAAFAFIMSSMAIMTHSLVDFNLQIPAIAATLVIIMALQNSHLIDRRRRNSRFAEKRNLE